MPLVLALLTATACLQRLEPIEDSTASHSVRLIVDGNVQPYDAEAGTKAAEAISWKTGDVIYIRTTTGSGTNTSYAQREADGSWTLNYTGTLRPGAAAQCCFIQKAKATSGYAVSLSYNSIIYEDKDATLTVSDGTRAPQIPANVEVIRSESYDNNTIVTYARSQQGLRPTSESPT